MMSNDDTLIDEPTDEIRRERRLAPILHLTPQHFNRFLKEEAAITRGGAAWRVFQK